MASGARPKPMLTITSPTSSFTLPNRSPAGSFSQGPLPARSPTASFSQGPATTPGGSSMPWNGLIGSGVKPGQRWADCLSPVATPAAATQVARKNSGMVIQQAAPVIQAARPAKVIRSRWADVEDTPVNRKGSIVTFASSIQAQSPITQVVTTLPVQQTRSWAASATQAPLVVQGPSFHMDSNPSSRQRSPLSSPHESDDEFDGADAMASYPCTPMANLNALRRDDDVERGSLPRIGIDIGGVLTREGDPTIDRNAEWGLDWEAPGAFNTVWQIVQVFGPENVFLVSKVRPGSMMQMQIEHWLHEVCKFCEITGVLKENIIFVRSMNGPDGKGVAAQKLGLSHFVDDKVECLVSVFSDDNGNSGDMVSCFDGTLFHLAKGGVGEAPPRLSNSDLPDRDLIMPHYCGVCNWGEVRDQLRERLTGMLRDKAQEVFVPGNQMKIDPNLERGLKPLFSSALRAAEEKPPWAVAPSASMGAAPEPKEEGRRPKLMLKPRDPTLGPVAGAATSSAAKVSAPAPVPVAAAAPVASKPAVVTAAPVSAAVAPVPVVRNHFPLSPMPAFQNVSASVQATCLSIQALALEAPRDPRARRMAPRKASWVAQSPKAKPAVPPASTVTVSSAAPAPQTTGTVIQQTPASVAQAALQKDPNGGRPRLQLKPRTLPVQQAVGQSNDAFCSNVNQKLR